VSWNHRNINYLNVDITQRHILIAFTSIITTEWHVHKGKKKIKPKYITEGWIDIIKIRFLTGHHVFYNSSCILQVTMYLTGHHVSYRSPCISQVTIYHLCFIVLIDWRMNTCNMKNIFFRFKRGWWVHRINLCTATFYLSGCAKPEQWAIMYLCEWLC
jgi:hypothetical protein